MKLLQVVSENELVFEGKRYRCAIGSNGFTQNPKEGGKATPIGTFSLRECWYRADRIAAPQTKLPLRVIEKDDGWCDEPSHPLYNRPIKLPFSASHEVLWRDDHNYDIIVPLGFNDDPVIPGLGSAIFFHIAKSDFSPTLGCVAISVEDMLEILNQADSSDFMQITPELKKK